MSDSKMIIKSYSPIYQESVVALWGKCNLTRPWNNTIKDIQRKSRLRLSQAVEEMTPLDALQAYLKSEKISPLLDFISTFALIFGGNVTSISPLSVLKDMVFSGDTLSNVTNRSLFKE